MDYYDEEFKPWEIVDGQCIVADETEWQNLAEIIPLCSNCHLNEQQCECPTWKLPIVKIVTDIFEEVNWAVVNSDLKTLQESYDARVPWTTIKRVNRKPRRRIGYHDLIRRFFRTVDSTPRVDYLIVTRHPERLRELWPVWGCHPDTGDLYCRDNVILATDIERIVPELLKCSDLCKGVQFIDSSQLNAQ